LSLSVHSKTVYDDWNIGKRKKFFLNLIIGFLICWVLPQKFAHFTETLLLLNDLWLFGYSLFYGLVFASALEVFGCYDEVSSSRIRHLLFSICSGFVGGILLVLSVWLVEYDFVGRYVFLYVSAGSGLFSYFTALVISKLASLSIPRVYLRVSEEDAKKVKEKAVKSRVKFLWVTNQAQGAHGNGLSSDRLDFVVIDSSETLQKSEIVNYLSMGSKILSLNQFWSEFFRSSPSCYIDQNWFVDLDLHLRNPVGKRVKRLLDILLSLLGLLMAVPLIACASLFILFESGFPVFYTQTRSGYMGHPYTLFKLRSMRQKSEGTEPKWAKKGDQRMTKIGSFLRKWRIDEIPQLWNVLKGEMSLVGPRPERPEFDLSLNLDIPYWNFRTLVKPGLTGWAQIRFDYASNIESSEEKLAYDLYYIKNASFFLDMEIILSTLRSINKGSR